MGTLEVRWVERCSEGTICDRQNASVRGLTAVQPLVMVTKVLV